MSRTRLRIRFESSPPEPPGGGERELLQVSDFTYLGNARFPVVGGHRTDFPRGFTHRYVEGQLRFFGAIQKDPAANGYSIMEFAYDGPLTTPGLASGGISFIRNLGDGPIGGSTMGLKWDEPSGKLIQTGDDLYTASTTNPTVGYSTINEGLGTLNNFGPWRFDPAGSPTVAGMTNKKTDGGVVKIPSWWRDLYTPGRDWAAGFGTYRSLVHTGGTIGPTLTAFDLADLSGATPGLVPNTVLLDYGYTVTSYTVGEGNRPRRDNTYISQFDDPPDHWNPNPEGWWTWTDQGWQFVEWIDTGTKHGIFMTPTMSHDDVFYASSTLNADGEHSAWFMYDPADLATVAMGAAQPWDLQPAWRVQPVTYPGWDTLRPGWANSPNKNVGGVSFDPTTNILYVCAMSADSSILWPTDNPATVHFYQVAV